MIDSIVDFFSELLGKVSENAPDLDGDDVETDSCATETVCGDGDDCTNGDGTIGPDAINTLANASSQVISGNNEVDDLLTNGINTSAADSPAEAEVETHGEHHHPRSIGAIPFTGAAKCNLCSCGHYVGRDGVNDICICGHAKWQHEWV